MFNCSVEKVIWRFAGLAVCKGLLVGVRQFLKVEQWCVGDQQPGGLTVIDDLGLSVITGPSCSKK
jgi:hypothetical protein